MPNRNILKVRCNDGMYHNKDECIRGIDGHWIWIGPVEFHNLAAPRPAQAQRPAPPPREPEPWGLAADRMVREENAVRIREALQRERAMAVLLPAQPPPNAFDYEAAANAVRVMVNARAVPVRPRAGDNEERYYWYGWEEMNPQAHNLMELDVVTRVGCNPDEVNQRGMVDPRAFANGTKPGYIYTGMNGPADAQLFYKEFNDGTDDGPFKLGQIWRKIQRRKNPLARRLVMSKFHSRPHPFFTRDCPDKAIVPDYEEEAEQMADAMEPPRVFLAEGRHPPLRFDAVNYNAGGGW